MTVREPGLPDTFFLGSVSPNTGTPQGGETISINGGGFSDPLRVSINGIGAVIQSASGTQIRVTTPRCVQAACFETGAVTPVDVTVTTNLNEEGQATDTLSSGFSYVNGGGGGVLIPTIFSVTPSSGPNEGGTQVTINGDGFEAPVAVDFGNTGNAVAAQVRLGNPHPDRRAQSAGDRHRCAESQPAGGDPGDESVVWPDHDRGERFPLRSGRRDHLHRTRRRACQRWNDRDDLRSRLRRARRRDARCSTPSRCFRSPGARSSCEPCRSK